MSLEIELSDPHEMMLAELREAHGSDEIDEFLQTVVSNEVHESYQQLQSEQY